MQNHPIGETPQAVYFTGTETKGVVARGRGEKAMGSQCSTGGDFQLGKMKKFWGWIWGTVA